ncbi:hypothetical protein OE88DRAFT_1656879, partial [Heliocybe sulcata]
MPQLSVINLSKAVSTKRIINQKLPMYEISDDTYPLCISIERSIICRKLLLQFLWVFHLPITSAFIPVLAYVSVYDNAA